MTYFPEEKVISFLQTVFRALHCSALNDVMSFHDVFHIISYKFGLFVSLKLPIISSAQLYIPIQALLCKPKNS